MSHREGLFCLPDTTEMDPLSETREKITLSPGPVVGVTALMILSPCRPSSLSLKNITYLQQNKSGSSPAEFKKFDRCPHIPSCFPLSFSSNWLHLCWDNFISIPGFCLDGWLSLSHTHDIFIKCLFSHSYFFFLMETGWEFAKTSSSGSFCLLIPYWIHLSSFAIYYKQSGRTNLLLQHFA